ncbi:hypothetical protein F4810DRAFT_232035 [Camillea tinctor]|nr:hypothetical protein F4810DRAFT_232035 [Camillea tinctor]
MFGMTNRGNTRCGGTCITGWAKGGEDKDRENIWYLARCVTSQMRRFTWLTAGNLSNLNKSEVVFNGIITPAVQTTFFVYTDWTYYFYLDWLWVFLVLHKLMFKNSDLFPLVALMSFSFSFFFLRFRGGSCLRVLVYVHATKIVN